MTKRCNTVLRPGADGHGRKTMEELFSNVEEHYEEILAEEGIAARVDALLDSTDIDATFARSKTIKAVDPFEITRNRALARRRTTAAGKPKRSQSPRMGRESVAKKKKEAGSELAFKQDNLKR